MRGEEKTCGSREGGGWVKKKKKRRKIGGR